MPNTKRGLFGVLRKTTYSSSPSMPTTPKTPKKRNFDSSKKLEMRGRETEIAAITSFIATHIKDQKSGSLYVSGKPGTGKTACINQIYSSHSGDKAKVNCFGIDKPERLYFRLLEDLNYGPNEGNFPSTPSKVQAKMLETVLTDPDTEMKLVVLDEIDQLLTRNFKVLKDIFLWPTLEGSRVILIGVSNVMDFMDNLWSTQSIPKHFQPQLIHFAPYSVEQIKSILNEHAESPENEVMTLDSSAVELCARKIASTSGDIRSAFGIRKRSIAMAGSQRKKLRLDEESSTQANTGIAAAAQTTVKITHIQSALTEQSLATRAVHLPMQQYVLICCALVLVRRQKQFTIGRLLDYHRKVCPAHGLPILAPADIVVLCDILAEAGFFTITKKKHNRDSLVAFRLLEEDFKFVFDGKPLMDAILNCDAVKE